MLRFQQLLSFQCFFLTKLLRFRQTSPLKMGKVFLLGAFLTITKTRFSLYSILNFRKKAMSHVWPRLVTWPWDMVMSSPDIPSSQRISKKATSTILDVFIVHAVKRHFTNAFGACKQDSLWQVTRKISDVCCILLGKVFQITLKSQTVTAGMLSQKQPVLPSPSSVTKKYKCSYSSGTKSRSRHIFLNRA